MERTREISKIFNLKYGEETTKIYLKSDNILLLDFFGDITKVSIEEFDINSLYCISPLVILRGVD